MGRAGRAAVAPPRSSLDPQNLLVSAPSTPLSRRRFPGLMPGDRCWCVTALNWFRVYRDGCAAPVVLASTHERTLDVVTRSDSA